MKNAILSEYRKRKQTLEKFCPKMSTLVEALLDAKGIKPHQVSFRLKDIVSLEGKIDQKKGKYTSLAEITDVCGIRVVTYLESEVELVAGILRAEFEIDEANSVGKRTTDINQFGYESLHLVASLNEQRTNQTEHLGYSGLKFEVQIRSILQHAWAEIEHDLGYKASSAIPNHLKRNFARLAALLETADVEFVRLRGEIQKYQESLDQQIVDSPEAVDLNRDSLLALLRANEILQDCYQIVTATSGGTFVNLYNFELLLEKFAFFGINNIGEIESLLSQNRDRFLAFVREFSKGVEKGLLDGSIPLYFFLHFLATSREDEGYLLEYLKYGEYKIGGSDDVKKNFVDKYLRSKNAF